jgi:hypothetical protein
MTNDRNARYGAATGIVFLVLVVVGFSLFGSDAPSTDAPGEQWAAWYVEHQDRIQVGLTLVGVSVFFFIWFLGSLRSALAAAEGGTGRLASVAFGGGILAAAFFMIAVTAAATAAFHATEPGADPNITEAINEFGLTVAAPAAGGFTALFAASAVVGYRHGAFAPAIAGLSALAAITQVFAYGTAVTETGAFAADGVLGLWVPFFGFIVGILALSVTLVRRPAVGPTAQ